MHVSRLPGAGEDGIPESSIALGLPEFSTPVIFDIPRDLGTPWVIRLPTTPFPLVPSPPGYFTAFTHPALLAAS